MTTTDITSAFRAELLKLMPGYQWTVHRPQSVNQIKATGTMSSGKNRMSTLRVTRTERVGTVRYEAKSSGPGTRAIWLRSFTDRTLAKALRGLHDLYHREAETFQSCATAMQCGKSDLIGALAGFGKKQSVLDMSTDTLRTAAARRGFVLVNPGRLKLAEGRYINKYPVTDNPSRIAAMRHATMTGLFKIIEAEAEFIVSPEHEVNGVTFPGAAVAERHTATIVLMSPADYREAMRELNGEIGLGCND